MLRRKKGPFNHGINKKAKQTIKPQREEKKKCETKDKKKRSKGRIGLVESAGMINRRRRLSLMGKSESCSLSVSLVSP